MFKKKYKWDLVYHKENYLKKVANCNINNLNELIKSQIGLDDEKRNENYKSFGTNHVVLKKFKKFKKLIEAFTEIFNILLLSIGILELTLYLTLDTNVITLVSALFIFFMIFLAVFIDFSQEYKAFKTSVSLHKQIENEIYVLNKKIANHNNVVYKKNELKIIKQSLLTIGDVIYLSAGDIVPADCRILNLNKLLVDQSTLTGENEYVTKSLKNKEDSLILLNNILFSQTTIKSGNCLAVVVNIHDDNYSESLGLLVEQVNTESDYEKSLNKISKILILFILLITPIIFIIAWSATGFSPKKFIEPLVFSLSIAVALVPEALPAIISANLKLGSKIMSKNKVIVKNLSAIQNMGSVNVLATDKTGTLTLDQFEITEVKDLNDLSSSWLNNLVIISAHASNLLHNKIDQAINIHFNNHNVRYDLIQNIDFSHENKISGSIVNYENKKLMIVKGSFEEMIKVISQIRVDNKVVDFNNKHLQAVIEMNKLEAKKSNKLLLISSKAIDNNQKIENLVFEGFICLQEKMKKDVKKIINIFLQYNIDIKVLTGDNKNISENLTKNIGLKVNKISGHQIDKQLPEVLDIFNLFYQLSPLNKAQIIEKLQVRNVVAFLGDGVNDAVALKKSDVGISVNNASGIAKKSADIIMLEKDLDVLENAFVQGRRTFNNAVKFVNITLASNFGLLLTLLISSIWFASAYKFEGFSFLPMSPIQLLLQNLIFDFANLVFVLDNVDEHEVTKPSKWSTKYIIPFAVWNGMVHVVISCINFLIIGYGFNLFARISQGDELALQQFQTSFFIEVVITHIVLIIAYRTSKVSLFQSRPNKVFALIMVGFGFMPFIIIWMGSFINKMELSFFPNPLWYLVLIGLIILSWLSAELFKLIYIYIFKKWY